MTLASIWRRAAPLLFLILASVAGGGSAVAQVQLPDTFAYRGPGNIDYHMDRATFDKGTHTETLAQHYDHKTEIKRGPDVSSQYICYTTSPEPGQCGISERNRLGMGITERRDQEFGGAGKGYELIVFGMLKAMSFKVSGNWGEDRMALRVYVDEIDCGDSAIPYYHNLVVAEVKSLQPGEVREVKIALEPRGRDGRLKELQRQINHEAHLPGDIATIQNERLVNYPTCAKRIQFVWELTKGRTIIYPEWKVFIDDLQIDTTNIYVRERWGGVAPWLAGFVSGDWITMSRGGYELGGSGYIGVRWESECCWPYPHQHAPNNWRPGRIDPALFTVRSGSWFNYVKSLNEFTTGALYPLGFYSNPFFRLVGPDPDHLGIVRIENREGDSGGDVGHYNLALTNVGYDAVSRDGTVTDTAIDNLHKVVNEEPSSFWKLLLVGLAIVLVLTTAVAGLYLRAERQGRVAPPTPSTPPEDNTDRR